MYEKARVLYEKPIQLVRKIKPFVRLCPNRTREPKSRLRIYCKVYPFIILKNKIENIGTCKHFNQKHMQCIELSIKNENGVTYHVLATVKEVIRPGMTIVIE